MNAPLLLGIDLGTTNVKAMLVDLDGAQVAEGGAPCAVSRPRPGWAETDPESWWAALGSAVGALPAEARARVAAIGLSGQQHGTTLTRDDGSAVRPALLWLDTRGAETLARYPGGAAERIGNAVTAGMTGPALLWLAEREPAALAEARWSLQPKDWLRLRLTGAAAADPSDTTGTSLSTPDGAWNDGLIAELGLRRALFAEVRPSSSVAGSLTPRAAAALGLPGVPVAVGAGDSLAAALGSGLLDEEQAQLAIGTSAQLLVPRQAWPGFSPRLNCFRSANPDGLPRFCQMAAMLNGGAAIDWARAALGLSWDDAFGKAFTDGAARSEALFLPYLAGERTPWMDPDVRGAWVGLSASDGPAQLMRAALVGVAYALRAGLDALRAHGASPARLRLAGGGTVHPAFRQLLADVLGVPLDAVSAPNAAPRGAALLGGLAAGLLRSEDLTRLAPSAQPVAAPRAGGEHDARYAQFRVLYAQLSDWARGQGRVP